MGSARWVLLALAGGLTGGFLAAGALRDTMGPWQDGRDEQRSYRPARDPGSADDAGQPDGMTSDYAPGNDGEGQRYALVEIPGWFGGEEGRRHHDGGDWRYGRRGNDPDFARLPGQGYAVQGYEDQGYEGEGFVDPVAPEAMDRSRAPLGSIGRAPSSQPNEPGAPMLTTPQARTAAPQSTTPRDPAGDAAARARAAAEDVLKAERGGT